MNRDPYIKYIKKCLSSLCSEVKLGGSLGLFDLNIHSENFFRDFLNLFYGLELININYEEPNKEGFDLIDRHNKIIIQVTSTVTKAKIESSLKKANPDKYKGYTFKFFFIVEDAGKLRGKGYDNPNGFIFDNINHIYDEKSLLKEINNKKTDQLLKIYQFFKREFEPLESVPKPFEDEYKEHLGNVPKPPKGYVSRTVSSLSDKKEEREFTFFQKGRKPLFQAIEEEDRIILLGDGGIGKTTELTHCFHKTFDQDTKLKRYPIYKSLCNYTEYESIEDFLRIPVKEVLKTRVLYLFDGLDEATSDESLSKYCQRLNEFVENNQESKIVVSCRTNFYNVTNNPLTGFKVFYLNELGRNDVNEYLRCNHISIDVDLFFTEVHKNNYHDLIHNPFYLELLAQTFERIGNLSLSRAELFNSFIEERIKQDYEHHKSKFDLDGRESGVKQILEVLAISFEILGRNYLKKDEFHNLLGQCQNLFGIRHQVYDVMRYFSLIKRRYNKQEVWRFEHNNIQEYLAAYVLSKIDYPKILRLICIKRKDNIIIEVLKTILNVFGKGSLSIPGTPISIPVGTITGNRFNRFYLPPKKIAPSWLNTVSFLLSILDKDDKRYKKLLDRLILNEKEVVVKFEPEKLPKDLRNNVFQSIFNTYKEEDLWVRSNKFDLHEFARFGQTDENIEFLLKELEDSSNKYFVYRETMILLCIMDIESDTHKQKIKELMYKHILLSYRKKDTQYTSQCIDTLRYTNTVNKETVKWLMKEVGDSEDKYIRSSIYSILIEKDMVDEHIDYIIDGYELWLDRYERRYNQPSSKEPLYFQEKIRLEDCFSKVKTPEGIKKIIGQLIKSSYRFSSIDDWFTYLISNAVSAYDKDKTIFDSVMELFINRRFLTQHTEVSVLLIFFDKTATRERAFERVWSLEFKGNEWIKIIAIGKIMNSSMVPYVVRQYNIEELSEQDIKNIYSWMEQQGNNEAEQYRQMIEKELDFRIEKHVRQDFAAESKEKVEQDFKLLFNADSFRREILRIFDEEDRDKFTSDELWGIQEKNGEAYYLVQKYSELSVGLLRNSTRTCAHITKQSIEEFFKNKEDFDYVRLSYIKEYLEGHEDIAVSPEQKKWITAWCQEKASKVNFRKAITKHSKDSYSYNRLASLIAYFSMRLNIEHQQRILLDMLSFETSILGGGLFDYAISKISDDEEIKNRVFRNLENGIDEESVLLNHCSYLAENNVEKAYPLVLEKIIDPEMDDWFRVEILKRFNEYVQDTRYLKDTVHKADMSNGKFWTSLLIKVKKILLSIFYMEISKT